MSEKMNIAANIASSEISRGFRHTGTVLLWWRHERNQAKELAILPKTHENTSHPNKTAPLKRDKIRVRRIPTRVNSRRQAPQLDGAQRPTDLPEEELSESSQPDKSAICFSLSVMFVLAASVFSPRNHWQNSECPIRAVQKRFQPPGRLPSVRTMRF